MEDSCVLFEFLFDNIIAFVLFKFTLRRQSKQNFCSESMQFWRPAALSETKINIRHIKDGWILYYLNLLV